MNGPRSLNNEQSGQVEVCRWGSLRQFDFEIRDHVALGEACDGLNFLAAAKLSGPRFVNLSGPIARLSRALGQFVLNVQTEEHGYEEIHTPCLFKHQVWADAGQLARFEDDIFEASLKNGVDLFLTPSAELSLINMVACLALEGNQLPVKMVMLTPCFRSEAGGAGADTFVTVKQRQYDEVGLIQVVTQSDLGAVHKAVTSHVEYVMRLLGIPYRVMARRVNDLGIDAVHSYDLEVWIPSRGSYRAISCCLPNDFQPRRIQPRLVGPSHCHDTLAYAVSCSLAMNLLLFAVLENYQQADGSIRVPEVLRSYMSGDLTIKSCLIAHGLGTT
ncbi:TPA: serine--tRNA ligase [Pseudomonas aeruginosa]|uniref:aminoacyl--tRNA ligase-related protein n=1 Tax=Pseudomonas putida TaxID=303 RepID=UPI00106F4867|nr:aminoacyl--tRNA ligase-related protein [Pseudomonas putida]TFF51343.1 serine--tRNA ligase [Pseudomonas putida]HCF4778788.1 serine--tRNA ligase [Pseudomonas aeruginosa]